MITELEFKSLASQGYNRIPLMAEAFADLETPLSLYLKLAHGRGDGKYSFLLESVVGGERFGRYSFIGLPARTLLRASPVELSTQHGHHLVLPSDRNSHRPEVRTLVSWLQSQARNSAELVRAAIASSPADS